MSTDTAHPLITWLTALLHDRSASTVAAKQLRARAELVLLHRHEPDPEQAHCRHDGEAWPCLEWRVIATGWAHAPGFDNAWLPARAFAVLYDLTDLDEEQAS